MANFKVKVTGLTQAQKKLGILRMSMLSRLKQFTRDEIQLIFEESQRQVPRLTHRLANSGMIQPIADGFEIIYTESYALPVHDIDIPHRTGKWRYLADPANEAQGGMITKATKRLRGAL
jgi:hypothetical protein